MNKDYWRVFTNTLSCCLFSVCLHMGLKGGYFPWPIDTNNVQSSHVVWIWVSLPVRRNARAHKTKRKTAKELKGRKMLYSWKECHCLCKLNLICFQIMFRTIVQCFLDSATREGNGSTSMGDVSSPHWLETVQTEYQGLCGNPLGDGIGWIWTDCAYFKKIPYDAPVCLFISYHRRRGKWQSMERGGMNCPNAISS